MVLLSYLKQTSPFFRFLLVGVINTLVGLSTIFFMMNGIDVSYWAATFIGNSVGACVSFLLNRTYTFNSRTSYTSGGLRFIVIILLCYFVSYSVSDFSVNLMQGRSIFDLIGQNELAVLIGTVLYTITNYFGQKWFVFYK